MPHAIDFTELKQRISIERAAEMLGLKTTKSGGQRRGTCPICKAGGDRAFVLTPAKGLYYCFGTCSMGGDAITMAANVRNCSLREAAEFLDGKGGGGAAASAKGDGSRNDSPQPNTEKGLRPLDYLQAGHPGRLRRNLQWWRPCLSLGRLRPHRSQSAREEGLNPAVSSLMLSRSRSAM
jgi:hypothetical protein